MNQMVVLLYLSGQDGLSEQDGAILPTLDAGLVLQRKLIMFWYFIPYNKPLLTKLVGQDG